MNPLTQLTHVVPHDKRKIELSFQATLNGILQALAPCKVSLEHRLYI